MLHASADLGVKGGPIFEPLFRVGVSKEASVVILASSSTDISSIFPFRGEEVERLCERESRIEVAGSRRPRPN